MDELMEIDWLLTDWLMQVQKFDQQNDLEAADLNIQAALAHLLQTQRPETTILDTWVRLVASLLLFGLAVLLINVHVAVA